MDVLSGRVSGVRSSVALILLWVLAGTAGGGPPTDNICDPGEAPDVIVGNIQNGMSWTTLGATTSFSIGTTSCNIGTCWANWIPDTPDHPVIAQNMYRLLDGRFEQIGQSWLKHGFSTLDLELCGGTCLPADGEHLGVDCSDPYSAFLNGQQLQLGPRSDVNPVTVEFPFPATDMSQTGDPLYKRLQVKNVDLDPALNAGASYYVEAQYLLAGDSQPGNSVSYRQVDIIALNGGFYDIEMVAPTVVGFPAVYAWAAAEPGTAITTATAPGDGRFTIATRVQDLGNGVWHYEYAVHNLNSHQAAGSFSLPLPFGVNLTNIGFHDVDYHSGEPYDGSDWTHNGGAGGVLRWQTTPYAIDPNANALRWGTLYAFRFDADVPPALGSATIGLFRPPGPGQVGAITTATFAPALCDNDGVCDTGEDCSSCAADCLDQAGGGGCCGDDVCDPGETPCTCFADCGSPQTHEFVCNDGIDADCDGLTDCADSDCCSDVDCDGEDLDGDTFAACDCNDADPTVWTRPSEARRVLFRDRSDLRWSEPIEPGAAAITYEVVRSANPVNFATSVTCVADADPTDESVNASETPPPDGLFSYLIRAVNGCPGGDGTLGRDSANLVRPASGCP